METTINTSDNIITRSYEEYYQVILTYITYRITHRYEAEDLTQDVFVRLPHRPDPGGDCWTTNKCSVRTQ